VLVNQDNILVYNTNTCIANQLLLLHIQLTYCIHSHHAAYKLETLSRDRNLYRIDWYVQGNSKF